jgi:hypothetical protein
MTGREKINNIWYFNFDMHILQWLKQTYYTVKIDNREYTLLHNTMGFYLL